MRLLLALWACSSGSTGDAADPDRSPTDAGLHSAIPTTPTADTGGTPPPGHSAAHHSSAPHSAAHSAARVPTGDTAAPRPPDYRSPGPHAATRTRVTSSATSCRGGTVADRFEPDGVPSSTVVVLGHGFSGSRGDMVGWGEHWATWGLTVLVPDLCYSLPWNVDHVQNGEDMVALAADLAPGAPVLYVGYSAGGLSALVAASVDPASAGHLGLDAVDAFSIAGRYASGLPAASADLHAEPSACNSSGNMLPIYDREGLPTVRVVDADHCDWMWPVPAGCRLACAQGPQVASIDRSIRSLSTSWLLWRSGLDPSAAAWWTPGEAEWDTLVSDGWIVP